MPRAAILLLLAACIGDTEGKDDPDLSDSYGIVSGSWSAFDTPITFRGGVAYGNAFFHDNRAVVGLTTWEGPNCADPDGDWLKQTDGYLLEIPYDMGSGTEEAKLFECESITGGYVCSALYDNDADITVSASGAIRGDAVTGSVDLLSGTGDVEGTVNFDVVYCGED
jgi:hypothetical protein